MCFSTRLGPPGADRHALNRRAEAAAKTSAAAYQTSGELVVGCACIGQPRDEEEPVPQVDECIRDPDLWVLPQRPDRIRLAFLWYIFKRGQEDWRHELAWSCVVRLDNAEERGVPLPADFAPDVAAAMEAGAEEKGAFPTSRPMLAGQLSFSGSFSARSANPEQRVGCGWCDAGGGAPGARARQRHEEH